MEPFPDVCTIYTWSNLISWTKDKVDGEFCCIACHFQTSGALAGLIYRDYILIES